MDVKFLFTIPEMAAALEMETHQVRYAIKRLNVKERMRAGTTRLFDYRAFNQIQNELLGGKELELFTLQDIAKLCGQSEDFLVSLSRKLGIQARYRRDDALLFDWNQKDYLVCAVNVGSGLVEV